MVHEHVRQIMIVPDHQPARRFLGDGARSGCELTRERPLVPTVGLYFATATKEMCVRLEARQARLDARADSHVSHAFGGATDATRYCT